MKKDIISKETIELLAIYAKAKAKKEQYVKTLGKKISKKEDEELLDKFFEEEYNAYLQQLKQKNGVVYPDINEDFEYDSTEFDELQDMLDEE